MTDTVGVGRLHECRRLVVPCRSGRRGTGSLAGEEDSDVGPDSSGCLGGGRRRGAGDGTVRGVRVGGVEGRGSEGGLVLAHRSNSVTVKCEGEDGREGGHGWSRGHQIVLLVRERETAGT